MALPKQGCEPGRPGPLEGVRVLDLSRLVAGNMLSLQLDDFGAEVVKVELWMERREGRLSLYRLVEHSKEHAGMGRTRLQTRQQPDRDCRSAR